MEAQTANQIAALKILKSLAGNVFKRHLMLSEMCVEHPEEHLRNVFVFCKWTLTLNLIPATCSDAY